MLRLGDVYVKGSPGGGGAVYLAKCAELGLAPCARVLQQLPRKTAELAGQALGGGAGGAAAAALGAALAANASLEEVDLRDNGIGAEALAHILSGLCAATGARLSERRRARNAELAEAALAEVAALLRPGWGRNSGGGGGGGGEGQPGSQQGAVAGLHSTAGGRGGVSTAAASVTGSVPGSPMGSRVAQSGSCSGGGEPGGWRGPSSSAGGGGAPSDDAEPSAAVVAAAAANAAARAAEASSSGTSGVGGVPSSGGGRSFGGGSGSTGAAASSSGAGGGGRQASRPGTLSHTGGWHSPQAASSPGALAPQQPQPPLSVLDRIFSRVRRLDLAGNPLGAAGARQIAALLNPAETPHQFLEELCLDRCAVPDAGGREIAAALHVAGGGGGGGARLRALSLARNELGDAAAAAFGALLEAGGRALRELDLSWNRVRARCMCWSAGGSQSQLPSRPLLLSVLVPS